MQEDKIFYFSAQTDSPFHCRSPEYQELRNLLPLKSGDFEIFCYAYPKNKYSLEQIVKLFNKNMKRSTKIKKVENTERETLMEIIPGDFYGDRYFPPGQDWSGIMIPPNSNNVNIVCKNVNKLPDKCENRKHEGEPIDKVRIKALLQKILRKYGTIGDAIMDYAHYIPDSYYDSSVFDTFTDKGNGWSIICETPDKIVVAEGFWS